MFLRTERLFLRPGWAEDAAELTAAIAHEEVARMLARVPWPYREDHARFWLTMEQDMRLPGLLITLPEERGRIVGGGGLQMSGDEVEIGYWITPDCWGRGFATEAARGLVLLAGQLGHRRLMGRHAIDNPASGRVLRKAGFLPTGRKVSIDSVGRGAIVEAPEYAIALSMEEDGDPMPAAA